MAHLTLMYSSAAQVDPEGEEAAEVDEDQGAQVEEHRDEKVLRRLEPTSGLGARDRLSVHQPSSS